MNECDENIGLLGQLNRRSLTGGLPPKRIEDVLGIVEQQLTASGADRFGRLTSRRIKYRNKRRNGRLILSLEVVALSRNATLMPSVPALAAGDHFGEARDRRRHARAVHGQNSTVMCTYPP